MNIGITQRPDTRDRKAELREGIGHDRHVAAEFRRDLFQFQGKILLPFLYDVLSKIMRGLEIGSGLLVVFMQDHSYHAIDEAIETKRDGLVSKGGRAVP